MRSRVGATQTPSPIQRSRSSSVMCAATPTSAPVFSHHRSWTCCTACTRGSMPWHRSCVCSKLRLWAMHTCVCLMAEFAFGCLEAANNELICPSKPELGNIHIRVGIHAGPVMGAVVGTLNRRFGLFGDAVNVASRMESTSKKDHIQCSAPFMKLLQEQWPDCASLAVPQGARAIKGKGTMNTFILFPLSKREEATLLKQQSSIRGAPC
mmetsp:Transcript_22049/g.57483  ORF Transcript_22049/g.57483 Transcript_22049/m.57483 type:complete len:209 (-) Transcript_22049:2258-2884(-)